MAEDNLEWKVQCLEKNLAGLRADVDKKMKIMERILNTRNEQFVVHKKLIEDEQALFQSVITGWKNSESPVSMEESLQTSHQHYEKANYEGLKRRSESESWPTSERMALRAKRMRSHENASSDPAVQGVVKPESLEPIAHSHLEWEESRMSTGSNEDSVDSDPDAEHDLNSGGETDEGDTEQDNLANSGMEKRIFVNYYAENPESPAHGSSDPVWIHFLREEKGTAALCKYCDQRGFQQIYKLRTPSLGLLRRHLKQKHKIFVEAPQVPRTSQADEEQDKNQTRKTIFLKHEDHIYTRYARRNQSRLEFWRCRDRTCGGRAVNRYGAIQTTREHSCLTTAADCDAILLREKVRELAQTHPTLSVANVIATAREGFAEDVVELVPTESLRRTIRRVRQLMLQATTEQGGAEWI